MKRYQARISTTHVDRHGDRMMLSALESALSHIHATYVPVGIEHDPRIPPQGRLARASVVDLGDGHYALDGEIEVFEPGEVVPLDASGREIPIHKTSEGRIELAFDRQLRSSADQDDIQAIANALGIEPEEEIKKALEPLAILTIAASFAAGAVATGFLSRLGEDAYEVLKGRLKRLFERRRAEPGETLLRFIFVVRDGDRMVQLELIASGPTENDIDALLGPCLDELDTVLPSLFTLDRDLRRFVFEYSGGSIVFKFAVRRDAVPLYPRQRDNDA